VRHREWFGSHNVCSPAGFDLLYYTKCTATDLAADPSKSGGT
jgi:hypothetical protein